MSETIELRTVHRLIGTTETIVSMCDVKAGWLIRLSGDPLAPSGYWRAMCDAHRSPIGDVGDAGTRALTITEIVTGKHVWAISAARVEEAVASVQS